MAFAETSWLSDSAVRDLFEQFPLALAVVDEGGEVEVSNSRFAELFDPASFGSAALLAVVRAPGRGWRPVRVKQRDGTQAQAQAQSLRVEDRVLLVIDQTPGTVLPDEVAVLHERIVDLERQSATDRLTGAWNRAHLDRVIEAEIARSVRFRQPLSLVLMDLDHFKRVNDTLGHQAGDAVLRHLVTLVRGKIRTADQLFRWGGEEFVVLAGSTGYRGAGMVAEALRRAVEEGAFPAVGAITVSVGVAEHALAESVEAWFARADAMLYAAKNGGRNRVCVDRCGSSDAWAKEHGRSALRLQWLEAYECGEPTIDSQHCTLFDLANALIDLSLDPQGNPAAPLAAMDGLIEHVVLHFKDEEALLENTATHGWPRTARSTPGCARGRCGCATACGRASLESATWWSFWQAKWWPGTCSPPTAIATHCSAPSAA